MRKPLNMCRADWKRFYRAVRCGRVNAVDAINAHDVTVRRGGVRRVRTWNLAKHILDILLHDGAKMDKATRRHFIEVSRTMGSN